MRKRSVPGVYARVSRYIDWISEYLPIEVADNDWLSETVDNGDTDVPGNGGQPDAGGGSTGPDDTTTPDDSGSTVDDGAEAVARTLAQQPEAMSLPTQVTA